MPTGALRKMRSRQQRRRHNRSTWLAFATFEVAILWNLKLLDFFSLCSGAPFTVTNGDALLLSIDSSTFKRVFWACSLALVMMRALFVSCTFVLSMFYKRFWSPLFLPIHLVIIAGYIVGTVGGYSTLTCNAGCFALIGNQMLKYKSNIMSKKLINLFLCVFPPSVVLCAFLVSIVLTLSPELVPQFRFIVNLALEEGYLTVGPTYYMLVAATTVADFWSLLLLGAIDATVVISHMLFLEMWTKIMDQLISNRSSKRVEHVRRRLQELLVSLQTFNVGNASTVFATKVGMLFGSVSSICSILLMSFSGNLLLLIAMSYLSLALPLAYPILYHRAYSVSEGLQRAKLELLAARKYKKADASFERRLRSISTKGVLVGSFRNFERESDLIYLGFIVTQVTNVVLTARKGF